MMPANTDISVSRTKGLLVALLALAVVAAVSPMYIMPGCTMERGAFDFSCSHGVITQHITESPSAQAGPVFAAVLVLGIAFVARGISLSEPVRHVVVDDVFDDPLGERMRT